MKYFEPTSINEAVAILAREDDARCVSGGATLVAMMNADLLSPSTLVGLRRVSGIEGITRTEEGLRIGAMTTHASIAKSDLFDAGMVVINRAANQIAHPPIRNIGTIGGSISHADPAADFPTALIAANASIEVNGLDGQRQIPADAFFLGYYETAVGENEIVTAIIVPIGPANARGEHVKVTRVDGDFATVSVSLVLAVDNNLCTYARIAVGAVAATPLHLDEADAVLTGSALDANDIAEAAAILVKAADPIDDVRGSANYRRALIPRLLKRAVSLSHAKA
ncbi:MAG: xanthine dehydrogenase family protein subunit M [Gammaproteobacteria bacterium]|nr:xanthine dehydrogenase family protein subunit M [Gammaproteobacteria bacterium]